MSEREAVYHGKIAVAGVGALGQMAAHELVRLGFRQLILIDKDVFTPGNKNRQLYAGDEVMGLSKVEVTGRELLKIDAGSETLSPKQRTSSSDNLEPCGERIKIKSKLNIMAHKEYITEANGSALIGDAQILVDCTDNVKSRLYLECLAEEKNIPLVHGAVEGWCGQAAVVYPGDRLLHKLYQDKAVHPTGTYVPTVNVIASLQAAEVYKLAMEKQAAKVQKPVMGKAMRGRVLWVDLMNQEYTSMKITGR